LVKEDAAVASVFAIKIVNVNTALARDKLMAISKFVKFIGAKL
jgi:hypothetical protein